MLQYNCYYYCINVPLILKDQEIIFSQAKHIIVLSVAKGNFGVKKVKAA
jgi:hypothetical protein